MHPPSQLIADSCNCFYQQAALHAVPADQWPIWAQLEEGKEGAWKKFFGTFCEYRDHNHLEAFLVDTGACIEPF